MTIQVMNGFCLSLRIQEFSRFPVKDKSETLSSQLCMPSSGNDTKIEKFSIHWGIESH